MAPRFRKRQRSASGCGIGSCAAGFERANSGHHHLLIDTELPPLDQPIPNDFNHLHYGAGQTESEITLKPGTHTLSYVRRQGSHSAHSAADVSTDPSHSSRSRNRENNCAADPQKARQKKEQMSTIIRRRSMTAGMGGPRMIPVTVLALEVFGVVSVVSWEARGRRR